MTWQLNMKACGRTSPASRTATGNEHKENTERDDRASNHQRLNVTRQFVEPSTEAAMFSRKCNFPIEQRPCAATQFLAEF